MTEQEQKIMALAIKDMQSVAMDNCYQNLDMLAKVAGAIVAIAGGALLSVAMPGVGAYLAWTAGVGIAWGGLQLAGAEGEKIERGDVNTINQYVSESAQRRMLAPYVEALVEAKKPSPLVGQETTQKTTQTSASSTSSTGMPSTSAGNANPSAPIPQAVARLDEAAPHLFMVGRTREGKSETLKHLIGTEQRVWYLTSKVTDKVPSHWQGYRAGGPSLPKQITWLLDQWEASFLAHLEGIDTNREWFVIDEAVGILQSLKTKGAKSTADRLRGFVVEALTSGAAVGAFMGILSQTGNAGPLGVDEDLLKNFSIVGCGKRKKAQMLNAFLKLTDLRITPDQRSQIVGLNGYWQLWENDGVCLSQVPLSNLPLKAVDLCPMPDDGAVPIPKVHEAQPSLKDRILGVLAANSSGLTFAEIRSKVKGEGQAKEEIDPEITDSLCYLKDEGCIEEFSSDRGALKYKLSHI